MRRPQPLPTPPRREPDETDTVSSGDVPALAPPRRAHRPVGDRSAAPTSDPARASSADVDPHAETAAIDDEGPFARRRALAPVVPIEQGADRADATPPEKADDERGDSMIARPPDIDGGAPRPTRRRDVWRAAQARRAALRRERRRFTVASRRRRMIWLVSIGAVLLVIAGSFVVAYSPLFAVRDITVVGARSLDTATIEKALADQLDKPLAAVDTDAVRNDLAPFAAIETYSVEARPPHGLVIRIVERTPVGVISADGTFTLVDAAGVSLGESRTAPEGQPLISAVGGVDGPAFRAIGAVVRSLPTDLRARVASATATTAHDVTLTLTETGTRVMWGGSDQSAKKAQVLVAAMKASPPDAVKLYDISSPHAVIIQ